MGALLNYPKFKAFYPGTFTPLAGGLLYTYVNNTVNQTQVAYSDILCTTPLSDPIVLDQNGEALIYLKGTYALMLYDAFSNLVWGPINNVAGIGSSSLVSIESYGGSLNTAVAAIGATPAQLLIDEAVTLTGSLTIPSTLTLQIIQGGSIALAGYNLAINGPFSCLHGVQCFSGSGTVTFGSGVLNKPADPTWWGDGASGVTKANAAINIIGILTVNSATPDLSGELPVYETANTTPTTITGFTNLPKGFSWKIIINDIYTTITFGTNIIGHGGNSWTPAVGDVLDCVTDGTLVYCTTSAWGASNAQIFTTSGTWTKPTGAKFVMVECIGGGGGGGGGAGATTSVIATGGGGGGGGGFQRKLIAAADLPSTVTVSVGNGGTGGTAGNSPTNATSSAFYSAGGYYCYGNLGIGGAAGQVSATAVAVGGNGGYGLNPSLNGLLLTAAALIPAVNVPGIGPQAGIGMTTAADLAMPAENGGGGGGGCVGAAAGTQGAGSVYGGGGGGGGGACNAAGSTAYAGGNAQQTGDYGNNDAGGAQGGAPGSTGAVGVTGSSALGGGGGGAGGGGNTSGTGGAGGNGGAPGGGGGGGGGVHAAGSGGPGGNGANGIVRVYTYF
jgi:hypothetical protein